MPLQATYGGAGGANNKSKTQDISRETITAQDKDGFVAVFKVKYGKNETTTEEILESPSFNQIPTGVINSGAVTAFEIKMSNTDLPTKSETKLTLETGN
jgi:hypothetical protein